MDSKTRFNFLAPFYKKMHRGAKSTAAKLIELGDFQPADHLLDLAGGAGRIAELLIDKVGKITIVDNSEGMLIECRKNPKLICVAGEADSIPFPDNTFDKAIIVDSFHHFTNWEKIAAEVKRVLKPGGRVILEEFNRKNFFGFFYWLVEIIGRFGSRFFLPKELAALWAAQGFSVELNNEKKGEYYLIAKK